MLRELETLPRRALLKFFWQSSLINRYESKIPVIILGTQRSGTTMLTDIFSRYPDCVVYRGHEDAAFTDSRIRSYDAIDGLIKRSHKRIIVFKSLNDTHQADRFLNLHPNAKALWIFRDYNDVVNSAVTRWTTAHRDIMEGIVRGYRRHPGQDAIQEGMGQETLDLVRKICKRGLSSEEGAALLWYCRNRLYVDLQLHRHSGVLLVKYEELVRNPVKHIRRVFDFIPCPFDPALTDGIFASSVGKCRRPDLSADLRGLCDQMMLRLDEQYAIQTG